MISVYQYDSVRVFDEKLKDLHNAFLWPDLTAETRRLMADLLERELTLQVKKAVNTAAGGAEV